MTTFLKHFLNILAAVCAAAMLGSIVYYSYWYMTTTDTMALKEVTK